jgi:hypothetical protein
LHARKHESLVFLKVDVSVGKHAHRTLLKKNPQPLHIEGSITYLRRFGYVHSQRRASATRDNKYPYPISGRSLLSDDFLEFIHCIV